MNTVTLYFPDHPCGFLYTIDRLSSLIPNHSHEDLEVNIVFSGQATYLVGDQLVPLSPGSCLYLLPDQSHQLLEVSEGLSMLICVFSRSFIDSLQLKGSIACLSERRTPHILLKSLLSADLLSLKRLSSEVHEARREPGIFESGMRYLLYRCWASFSRAQGAQSTTCSTLVQRLLRLLDGDTSLQVDQLAEYLKVSRSYLCREVSNQLGTTISEIRNRKRLLRFMQIHETSKTLLESALEAGFGSYAQFFRVCRRYSGLDPHELVAIRTEGSAPAGPLEAFLR